MVADNGNEFQKQMIKAAFWENQGVQYFLVFSARPFFRWTQQKNKRNEFIDLGGKVYMRVKMVKLNFIDEQLHINFQGLSKCKATQSLHS